MKITSFLKAGASAPSQLVLTDLEPSKDGRFAKGTTADGKDHVLSTKNILTAVERGTAILDEAADTLSVKAENYNVADSGLTLINYGGGGFNAADIKF